MEQFNRDYLISTDQYTRTINDVVLPYLKDRESQTVLPGKDNVPLYCVSYSSDHPIGSVLIVHGFTENTLKYTEIIHSLVQTGFSVLMYDQRGHGRSGRDKDIVNPSVTHVDTFEDYISDMEIVCDKLLSSMPKPYLLIAHSMGGAIGTLYLEKHPETFAGAALCSPMIAPNTFGIPSAVATAICNIGSFFGRRKHNPFFMKSYSGPEDFDTSCATDPVRFAWYDAIKAARPEFQNSAPSYGWTHESLRVRKMILSPGKPEKISCPVLLSAAEYDKNVLPGPQQELISRVSDGKYILVKNARHEIFRSKNDVFFPWWHELLHFLKSSAQKG